MTETPKYDVTKKQDDMELRRYPGYIQAEVRVDGRDYKHAVERGFNILAGYIFGSNTASQKVAMTTPVKVNQSQKIAMTTPVTVSGKDSFVVAFVMPAEYTLQTLPVPNDPQVQLKEIPEHTMVVVRFSGYFPLNKIEDAKKRLGRWVQEQGFTPQGEYIVAGYNPPWVPGFLARNEVMVRVVDEM